MPSEKQCFHTCTKACAKPCPKKFPLLTVKHSGYHANCATDDLPSTSKSSGKPKLKTKSCETKPNPNCTNVLCKEPEPCGCCPYCKKKAKPPPSPPVSDEEWKKMDEMESCCFSCCLCCRFFKCCKRKAPLTDDELKKQKQDSEEFCCYPCCLCKCRKCFKKKKQNAMEQKDEKAATTSS